MTKVEGEHPGPLPCTRYAEGAEAEQRETLAFLEAIPERVIHDWGLNAVFELTEHCRADHFKKGAAYWKET